jgi:hypothetical protein
MPTSTHLSPVQYLKGRIMHTHRGLRLQCILPWLVGIMVQFPMHAEQEPVGLDWWSFQPLRSVQLPPGSPWARNPVDHFIHHRLAEHHLQPSKTADRATLMRRLSFDLIGLPPSPIEMTDFQSDTSPDAYEKRILRLLASPHYGERWGRHWLDAVHFGESNGFEYNQPRNHAWPYRNWIIDALNQDMPYDLFVRMQLAGDTMGIGEAGIIATGFLVTGPHNTTKPSNDVMRQTMRQDEMEDMVALVSQTFLGLTSNCARCHDHKFDPITMEDYYGLASALAGVEFGERALEVSSAVAAEGEGTQAVTYGSGSGTHAGKAWAITSIDPGLTHVLGRGDVKRKGKVVSPGGIAALQMLKRDFELSSNARDPQRRNQLATWITDPLNPLFARVIVNRIWMHHFGQGLVVTPNDFGVSGGLPSHPDLLDWLAGYLIDHQWSLKSLHLLITTSATYQQASTWREKAATKDAGNRFLWRMHPSRLEGEVLRDTLLQLSGWLDPTLGGVGYRDMREYKFKGSHFYDPVPQDQSEQFRRTIYRFSPRGARRTLLDTFDCPDPSAMTPKRATTTTPLQSLGLMNNALVVRLAQGFAKRLEKEVGSEIAAQVSLACRLAYGRPAQPVDLEVSLPFIQQHGLAAWCRVLFNANELLYVR